MPAAGLDVASRDRCPPLAGVDAQGARRSTPAEHRPPRRRQRTIVPERPRHGRHRHQGLLPPVVALLTGRRSAWWWSVAISATVIVSVAFSRVYLGVQDRKSTRLNSSH